jgi:hypothetical protein
MAAVSIPVMGATLAGIVPSQAPLRPVPTPLASATVAVMQPQTQQQQQQQQGMAASNPMQMLLAAVAAGNPYATQQLFATMAAVSAPPQTLSSGASGLSSIPAALALSSLAGGASPAVAGLPSLYAPISSLQPQQLQLLPQWQLQQLLLAHHQQQQQPPPPPQASLPSMASLSSSSASSTSTSKTTASSSSTSASATPAAAVEQQVPFVYYSSLEEEIRMENLRKRKEEEEQRKLQQMQQQQQNQDAHLVDDGTDADGQRRLKRIKKDHSQVEILEEAFKNNPLPSKKMKEKLALEAGLTPRAVQVRAHHTSRDTLAVITPAVRAVRHHRLTRTRTLRCGSRIVEPRSDDR